MKARTYMQIQDEIILVEALKLICYKEGFCKECKNTENVCSIDSCIFMGKKYNTLLGLRKDTLHEIFYEVERGDFRKVQKLYDKAIIEGAKGIHSIDIKIDFMGEVNE